MTRIAISALVVSALPPVCSNFHINRAKNPAISAALSEYTVP